jgi:hypothetical protein
MDRIPPGIDHHAAIESVAARTKSISDTAIKNQTAKRPDGAKTTVTAELPAKTRKTYKAQV